MSGGVSDREGKELFPSAGQTRQAKRAKGDEVVGKQRVIARNDTRNLNGLKEAGS
jgi:hypothetical protein